MKTVFALAIAAASLALGVNHGISRAETSGLTASTAVHVEELVALVVPEGSNKIVGACKIKVVDGDGLPVAGVAATIAWSGARTGTGVGSTDANGRVDILFSDRGRCKAPYVDYTCTIQSLSKPGYSYDAGANLVSSDGDDCRF